MKSAVLVCLVMLSVQNLHIDLKVDSDTDRLFSTRVLAEMTKEELTAVNNHMSGDCTLGGGYKIDFSPDLTSTYSWVPYKGCTGGCWQKSTIQKALYECPDKVCSQSTEREKITNPIITQKTMKNGVQVTKGFIGWANVNLGYHDIHNVKMLLAQGFKDRASLQNYMSLSFGNTEQGVVGKAYTSKFIKENKFGVYIEDKQKFLTLGTEYDYLIKGSPVLYKQNDAEMKTDEWTIRTSDILYDGKMDAYKSLMKNVDTTSYLDPNTAGIGMPKVMVDQYIATTNKLCKVNSNNVIECDCKGDKKKIKSFGFIFNSKNDHQWYVNQDDLVKVNKDKKCVLAISQISGNKIILGRAFFKKKYIIFDKQHQQIKIAHTNPVDIKSFKQNDASYWSTIVAGGVIGLLTIAMLMCVCFKDINESDIPSSASTGGFISAQQHSGQRVKQIPVQQPLSQSQMMRMNNNPIQNSSNFYQSGIQQSYAQPQIQNQFSQQSVSRFVPRQN